MSLRRMAVVLNPRAAEGRAAVWAEVEKELAAHAEIAARLETRGDGHDVERIAEMLAGQEVEVLAAAGGDGTVNAAATALLAAGDAAPSLAILPLGTANNVARSLGLESLRAKKAGCVELAVGAAVAGPSRPIDVGEVNGRLFAGSFCLGIDADILALRNRWRRRFALTGSAGGYALYLASCAANLLRPHGGRVRLCVDGVEVRELLYTLNVLNAPVYAGEFRFDADNTCDDGRVDFHLVSNAAAYVWEYRYAWPRHLQYASGKAVQPSPYLRRAAEIVIEIERPVAAQIDGEEIVAADSYHVRVRPGVLSVCTP
jgi:diacylglycerol kinase family enzyme